MRRGCISLGEIQCDGCQGTIRHSERYLAIDEEDSAAPGKGKTTHYCPGCALQKGFAYYREGNDGQKLTFFPEGNIDQTDTV